MKLKSILIAAIALTGFTGNVLAQRDITSQYITNATLSNGTNGWTVSNFNTPQQGNNTVGYASEAYAGWENLDITSYSMTQSITLPKGSFRLVNYSFFRQGLRYNTDSSKSLAFLKAGNTQVAIKTLGSISGIPTDGDNGGYANSQADGANCFDSKMYRNVVEFEIDADNTSIDIGIVGTFDLKQSWCIAGMFELFDLNDEASVSSPTDVTYAITNPGFEYRNLAGWTADNIAYQDNNWGNKAGVGFAEAWQWDAGLSNRSITQEITGLPNGLYELSVYAHNINQRNGDAASTGMFVTANNSQTEIGAYGQYKVRSTITDGNLTIGVKLQNCTGNWVAFDRFELSFYGDPDAALRDLIDAYVAEAEGLLAGADANYLTSSEKSALQQAVADAKSATSDNLSDRLETLISTLNTSRTQIQTVKDNRVQMIAALERFENDYNLTDGTDYRRQTMSAGAWTDLLAKVNAVSTALDDVSQASNYGTVKDELVAQMDATDTSLRLFKSYKAMVEGTTALGLATESDSQMDTDATENTAITTLNTAFVDYQKTQSADIDMSGFLGANLDFSAAAGNVLNSDNSNTIKAVTGWEVNYADADTWAFIQTDQSDNDEKLYMRKNWGSSATTLEVFKQKMLPAGSYTLSFLFDSTMENMDNLCYYQLGTTKTTIGEATSGAKTLTYSFDIEEATPFDLHFGFKKKNTGDTPAQILVDDITLKAEGGDAFQMAYNAAKDVQASGNAAESAVNQYSAYDGKGADLKATGIEAYNKAVAVLQNAKMIVDNNGNATSLVANADFTGGTTAGTVPENSGTVAYPKDWNFIQSFEGWRDTRVNDGVFNVWAGTINQAELYQTLANLPNGVYRLTANVKTDQDATSSTIAIYGLDGSNVGRSNEAGKDIAGSADNFANYSCAFDVASNGATIGIRSDKAYYQLKDIQLIYVAQTAEAETDASYLRQNYFWNGRNSLWFDATNEKYSNASGVVVYPQQANQLIKAASAGQFADTNNKIVNGTCASFVLTDGEPLSVSEAFTATSVTNSRTLATSTENAYTVCLPYPLSSSDNIKFYELASVSDGTLHFNLVTTTEAYKPYLVRKLADGGTLNTSAVTVAANPSEMPTVTADNYTMSGTVSVISNTDAVGYYILQAGNQWGLVTSDNTDAYVPAFRAYIQAPNGVRQMLSSSFDSASSITTVEQSAPMAEVYDLQGRLVTQPAKGLYIVNGKKQLFK